MKSVKSRSISRGLMCSTAARSLDGREASGSRATSSRGSLKDVPEQRVPTLYGDIPNPGQRKVSRGGGPHCPLRQLAEARHRQPHRGQR
jgi:hypothetical protein